MSIDQIKNKKDFINHIMSQWENYTNTYKKIANYLLNNFVDVAFMTAKQWAKNAGTSEISVIRFVRFLGYDGYPHFVQKMHQIINKEMTMTDYLHISMKNRRIDNNVLLEIIKKEEQNFNQLINKYSPKTIENVLNLINEAECLLIVGLRSSSCLAEYSEFIFSRVISKPIIKINVAGTTTYDLILPLEGKKVLALFFGYPRYPSKTIEILHFVKKMNWPIISITNDETSPLVPLSDYVIYAPANSVSFTDSMSTPIVMINTIVLEYIYKFHDQAIEKIKRFEEIAKEFNYYYHY
ncbi:MurR/RpiR family transcriptional regulator [Thermovenabulum sp.]|uniref:MurR/RpiR family transcriptional regulator n=1 Tax=Thermovenabulum sp. TaxID=3100335 RepID=UPI003C7ABCE7